MSFNNLRSVKAQVYKKLEDDQTPLYVHGELSNTQRGTEEMPTYNKKCMLRNEL